MSIHQQKKRKLEWSAIRKHKTKQIIKKVLSTLKSRKDDIKNRTYGFFPNILKKVTKKIKRYHELRKRKKRIETIMKKCGRDYKIGLCRLWMECDAFVPKHSCNGCGKCNECFPNNNSATCNNCGASCSPGTCNSRPPPKKMVEYHEFEIIPLGEKHEHFRKRTTTHPKIRPSWKGPLKAIRLLIVVALLPALFIAVPLYLRYFVFSGQMYPVGMSDMRLIDKKVSTTWCQRQVLRSNGMFNAFLLSSEPKIANNLVPVSMTRHLMLEDDMKEYWGFYLLQGSIVTVSTCVRWPGASLIMIRGHKHLQECAYIGDDSSEELDEILRANGGIFNDTVKKADSDSPTNKPEDMIRQLGNIKFHKPRERDGNHHNLTRASSRLSEEKDTLDPKVLEKILQHLQTKQEKQHKIRTAQLHHNHIVTVPKLTNRYRDTNINEDEEQFLSFKDLETDRNENIRSETLVDSPKKINNNPIVKNQSISLKNIEDSKNISNIEERKLNTTEDILEVMKEEKEEGVMSSTEIFDDIFNKLSKMGPRGKEVLNRLNNKLDTEPVEENISLDNHTNIHNTSKNETENAAELAADKNIDKLKQLIVEIMEEIQNKKAAKRSWKDDSSKRRKRNIVLSTAMQDHLNEEDEKGNAAIEDGFEPDGIADHHSIINETTANDMSRSEFWSSFSSSEEALLECDGLILNLPLTPHKGCKRTTSDILYGKAALANTITYKVPTNGYYFFVFNSENELQTNYIRVKFDLQKTIYDLSNQTMECKNSTADCAMPLSFFSAEKVVLEVPISDNDSLWNEEFVVMSECEPRTSIYMICVISVPILILVIAFQ